ncbi:MAG: chain-length determining protein [Sphingomonas sp.]|nr:chain-length determining protein [Sphingomonas sp.]
MVKEGVLPFMRKNPLLAGALLFALLSSIYWLFIASNRYVSEAHVIVQRTEMSAGVAPDITSLLTGGTATNRGDQLVLRDYLLSMDMVRKLDAELGLAKYYSSWRIDPFSKGPSNPTIEELHRYYLSRVSVEYDDYAGVLIIKAEGFDPSMAQAISKALVRDGETFMNSLVHGLARDQVAFLEKEVTVLGRRAMDARRAVLNYQNHNSLVSPTAAAEAITAIVAKLEAQRTQIQTQLIAMQAYLVPDHPNIVELEQQIDAISEQIDEENAKLASPQGNTLNRKVEEFQRLEMEAQFSQDLYKTALVALEKGRVEGTRTIKKMSIVQAPTLPEYPGKPSRLYQTFLYCIMAMLVAGVGHLLLAIVKDHRD